MLRKGVKDKYPYKNGKRYKVQVEEIKVTEVTIKARNLEEAKQEALRLYKNGDIIPTARDYKSAAVHVESCDGEESSEWTDV